MAGMVSLCREGCQPGPIDFRAFRHVKDEAMPGKRKDDAPLTRYMAQASLQCGAMKHEYRASFRNAERSSSHFVAHCNCLGINTLECTPFQAALLTFSACSRCGRFRPHNGVPDHAYSIVRESALRQARICNGYSCCQFRG